MEGSPAAIWRPADQSATGHHAGVRTAADPAGPKRTGGVAEPAPAEESRWRARYRAGVIATDVVVIIAAVIAGQLIRFPSALPSIGGIGTDLSYTSISVLLVVAWNAALGFTGAWHRKIVGTGALAYSKVAKASFLVFGLLAGISYLGKMEIARGYVAITLPVGMAILLAGRLVWNTYLLRARRHGRLMSPTVVVGSAARAVDLASQLSREPLAGYRVVGLCIADEYDAEAVHGEFPVLGSFADVIPAAERTGATIIAVAQTDALSPKQVRLLSWSLEETDLDLVVAPMLSDVTGPRIHSEPVPGLPLVHLQRPHLRGPQFWLKAAFDYCVALLALVVTSPAFLAAAIAIKLDDRGPVFFRQERVGLGEKPFRIWKFRTMTVGAEAKKEKARADSGQVNAVFFKSSNDHRITRVGRFLRKTSIDELPQLFNIMTGDMSIVGPRPLVPEEGAEIEGFVSRRANVRPGLTGLWQVSGRSEVSGSQRARLDLLYVESWSFTGDLNIIFRTVRAVLSRKGAM